MNALVRFTIVLVISMGACTLLAQSLGEVARESRNARHPRAKRVVTNDEIPSVDTMRAAPAAAKTDAAEGAEGSDDKAKPKPESKAGSEKDAAKAPEPGSAASELAKKDEEQKEWSSRFSFQREKISLQERELKLAEQEFQQKQIAHMGDVNARVNNQQQYAEAERLDREELAQKQQKLNAEREKLNGMQEEARHAGVKLPD